MLGQYGLFPYLKGWEYKWHVAQSKAVVRGADPITPISLSETGYLLTVATFTTDCYGTLILEYQGADLQTQTFRLNPEIQRGLGAFLQDPAGWLQRYTRPDPNSTAGVYVSILQSGGFQGAILPYVPTVKMQLHLPTQSTQASAHIWSRALVMAIINKKAFIRSLRRVLDAKADLWIDPALLAIGPAEFEEVPK